MKSEYEFDFSTDGFRFSKSHSFTGTTEKHSAWPSYVGDCSKLKVEFKIVPDLDEERPIDPKATQTGKLYVTFPFRSDGVDDFISHIVITFAHQINFNNSGFFDIDLGTYFAELIPETEEEKEELGDRPHFGRLSLTEVIPDPTFDSKAFTKRSSNLDMALVALYNHATKETNIIDRFLSLFKVLEDFAYKGSGKTASNVFKKNGIIREKYLSSFVDTVNIEPYEEFVDSIIKIRNECAHFKRKSNFGFEVQDIRLKEVKEKYVPILQYIAYELITHGN